MPAHTRVLDQQPISSLDDYVAVGGGRGLARAVELGPDEVIELIVASGLRGRGGGGFPTGLKWRTVAANGAATGTVTVVVNAAEGEPGTFKDRALIRRNPYRVLEGALVAAYAMGAPRVRVATKASFTTEVGRLQDAVDQFAAAGIASDVAVDVVGGPDSYLYGEETALLEVVAGRQPFPRVAPPFRRGFDSGAGDVVLVDNVETLANVAGIVVEGPDWFRSVGTDASPGTIVCTVSGDTIRHGIAEFAMGTPIAEVIDSVGRGPANGRQYLAAMTGTANALVPADEFETPLSYDAMSAVGSGLGTAGLIVFDDSRDVIDIGRAVAHFLAIESCGQCEPCKLDGAAIAGALHDLVTGGGDESAADEVRRRVGTVAQGARCALARQQEAVIGDLVVRWPDRFDGNGPPTEPVAAPVMIAPIIDLVDGRFVLDETSLTKQPDWSHDEVDSGKFPVDRLPRDLDAAAPAAPAVGERIGEEGVPRDPFAPLLGLHASIREDLNVVLGCSAGEFRDATAHLERDLLRELEVTGRVLFPMVERVTAAGDDAVWSAELHALDALALASDLEPDDDGRLDRRRVDRLANDVRRYLADNERIVYPLLRMQLDTDELTDLANAVDEVLVSTPR